MPPKPIVITRRAVQARRRGLPARRARAPLTCSTSRARRACSSPRARTTTRPPPGRPTALNLVFVSNRTADADSSQNTDVFVVRPATGATAARAGRPRLAATSAHVLSPTARWSRTSPAAIPKDLWYGTSHGRGGAVRRRHRASAHASRSTATSAQPRFARRRQVGSSSCSRTAATATSRASGRPAAPSSAWWRGERDVQRLSTWRRGGQIAVLESQPQHAGEVSARRAGDGLRRLTHDERRAPEGHPARHGRALQGEERRRHGHRRLPDAPARRARGQEAADDPAHPRRARSSQYSTRVQARVADAGRARLRGGRGQPARLVRLRARLQPRASGPTGATRTTTT